MEQKAIEQGLLIDAKKEAKILIEAFIKNIPGADQYKIVFI